MTPLSFDSEKQSFNVTCNLAASAVIKGDDLCSLLKYSLDSIMFCDAYKAIVVALDTMVQLKVVNINTIDDKTKYNPLITAHLIPGTDYKFMLEFYDSQFVYLRNV